MQGTTYILENHVNILKYFIQLKILYCKLSPARVRVRRCMRARVCVCVRVRLFSKFKQ